MNMGAIKKSNKSTDKEPVTLREKVLSSGNKSLYLDVYRNGKRSYEFLKLYLINAKTPIEKELNRETLATAQAIKAKRQIEIQNGEYGLMSKFKQETPFLNYFRSLCDSRRDSKGNAGNWNSCLKHLERYCDEDITFKDITPEWVEGFKYHLEHTGKDMYKWKVKKGERTPKPLSQNSKVSYFNKLRACINQAFEERLLPVNPLRGIKGFKEEQTERVYLTLDEVKMLSKTECSNPILKRAFLFSCLTGLRKSDIERLQWNQVHSEANYTRITFKQKKTGGQEYLDINKQAVDYLGKPGKGNELVFQGFRYNTHSLYLLSKWCTKAGIAKDVTFHTGRHTFAVLMLDLGAEIYTVSKLLGHEDLKTTQIYAKILDKKKQEAVNLIPDINL